MHRGAGADIRPEVAEVVAEGLPQGLGEGLIGHVEEQALRGAEEVDVEHQQQFRGGQFTRVGEEAAREHLEGQMVRGFGEADTLQEGCRAHAVEAFVDLGHADVQEGQRGPGVHRGEVAPAEGGAEGDEAERAERRRPRDTGEAVGQPAAVPQRVVRQWPKTVESRIGTPQQAAQVVVLAEEGVEAAAHRRLGTVGETGAPPREPAAERLLTFVEGHPGAAFGQQGGRGETGDPSADHGDARRVRRVETVPAGRGHHDLGLAVPAPPGCSRWGAHRASPAAAEPFRARKVCTMPVCHPATGAARTPVNPAPVSRAVKSGTVSKSRTLRHR